RGRLEGWRNGNHGPVGTWLNTLEGGHMSKMSPGLLAFVFATLAVGVPLHGQRKTNVLTAEEIEHAKLTTTNAYYVVEQLRPRWFATRGIATIPGGPGGPLQGGSDPLWVNG